MMFPNVRLNMHWPNERVFFGAAIICGFYSLATLAVVMTLDESARQLAKDALLVVGPLLGVIVQSIFKTDKAEAQRTETAAMLAAKLPDQSNAASIVVPAPANVEVTTDETK